MRTPELKKRIAAKVRRNPARSMKKMAREEKVGRESMRKLCREDLQLKSYKKTKETTPQRIHS